MLRSDHESLIRALLRAVVPDPEREGLQDTPKRFMAAMNFWTSGYGQRPEDVLKTFEDGAEGYNGLVFQGGIPIYSLCVVGSTFVETPRGRIPIKHLRTGDWVYTVDPGTLELGLVQCVNPRMTRASAQLVRVYTDNDTLLCTPDHRILVYGKGWVEAQNLTNGDRIVSLYRGVHWQENYSTAYVQLLTRKFSRKDKTPHLNILGQSWPVSEHRFVAKILGSERALQQHFVVHHKDEVSWNNDPSNIEPLSTGEHNKAHRRTEKLVDSPTRKQRAAEASGRPDVRMKRAQSVKQHWANMSPDEYNERIQSMRNARSRNHFVYGVEHTPWREDVWCMDIPGTQTFFANGMAVHNCEHHMAPFFGVAHIGYIPHRRIVGLSKLARVADIYARRLQVQERLGVQICNALGEHLQPRAVGVVLQCRHLCMESRGVQKHGTVTTTSALRGEFMTEPETRAEFMSFVMNASKEKSPL